MIELSDRDIRAAFLAATDGSPAPDLRERIHAAAAATPQQRGFLAGRTLPNPFAGRLAFAALVSVTTVALVGGLLASGSFTPDPTTPLPVESPSPDPSPDPASPSPTPDVTPSPTNQPSGSPVPGLAVDGLGRVVAPDGVPVASSPTDGDVRFVFQEGTEFFVVAGPIDANGGRWYDVVTLDGSQRGWLAFDPTGPTTVEPSVAECHTTQGWPADRFAGLLPLLAIACFGDASVEVTGTFQCQAADIDRSVFGPEWLRSDRYCAFLDEGGQQRFEVVGPVADAWPDGAPTDVTIVGHVDDASASECQGGGGEIGVDDAAAQLICRSFFHAESITPAG